MSPPPPERIGAYTIEQELGRGGMGVVYLGRDTRLDRAVAIKAMPEHVAQDPDRLARFEREAKTLATLSHPNVAGIYGVEEQDGRKYLILEYVEGESLADRLDRGPLPVQDALEIAAQIAAGVEAAHEAGVIHRDLKPGNVVVTADGVAKVLDFGLARFEESSSSSAILEDSPTLTSPVKNSPTMPGVFLGTASYMSPEQARGRRVDKRSDIWSFGVVLYELLTGASPFVGETATDSIGAILHKDIDLDRLPDDTPPNVRHVLRRCLTRDKKQRYRDIGDVLLELTNPVETQTATTVPRPDRRLTLAVAAVAVVALAGWAFTWSRGQRPAPETGSLRLSIPLEGGLELRGPLSISPDGVTVAFPATDQEGNLQIYLRRLDAFEMHALPDSKEGENPVFSPDGSSIAFFSRNLLARAPVSGGSATRLVGGKSCVGISWGEDGTIVYSEGVNSPLLRIPETGAAPETLTALADDGAYAHVWPQHIPGTRKLLFTSWVGGPNGGARILDLDTRRIRPLTTPQAERSGSFTPPARWSASGHIIFERFGAGLQALPFDPDSEAPVSLADAQTLLENVYYFGSETRSQFSLSDNGVLAYTPGDPDRRHLVLVDAAGNAEPIVSQEDVDEFGGLGGRVAFSADEKRVLLGAGGIMEVDLDRRLVHGITDLSGVNTNACWAPGEKKVIFGSNFEERWSIWLVGTAPGSAPELLLRRDRGVYPHSVAPDGSILFYERSPETSGDLWVLDPHGEATPVVATRASEHSGRFSPDGRWIAYTSDATGQEETYVVPAEGGTPIQVSTGGGDSPQWSPKGTSLYFRRERKVLRVGFDAGRLVGTPEIVFDAPRLLTGTGYDISADETRMVAIQIDDEAIPDEIRVVTSFFDELRRVAGPGSRR